jgi:predicted outer membrane repeat protein
MHRLFRLSILMALFGIMGFTAMNAATPVYLSGGVPSGEVKVILNDPSVIYYITGSYTVAGTLIIEPGTEIYFLSDSRIVDSCGGRIIADGFAGVIYNANPEGVSPKPDENPYGWQGYGDLAYFLNEEFGKTIDVQTMRDLTVHPDKYNDIFNVVLNTTTRTLKNVPPGTPLGANEHFIPFEKAILYVAGQIADIHTLDYRNLIPWKRINGEDVDFEQAKIRFIGRPVNAFSKEWGHIVVLPGARAAFFRNCSFENFRKDTTVDNKNFYNTSSFPGLAAGTVAEINRLLKKASNGGGGVITTFSSRTWLLNCDFKDNFARHNGGALQILQAPEGYPVANLGLGFYPQNKNPFLTNQDNSLLAENTNILRIDNIDEPASMAEISCYDRQAYDDARIAAFLGRMRNLKFENNIVQLANYGTVIVNGIEVTQDITDVPATLRVESWRNQAFGGAIYVASRENDPTPDYIGIGFGVNEGINTIEGYKSFNEIDFFQAINNTVRNYQNSSTSKGARGGALYIGDNTTAIVKGKFLNNRAVTPFITSDPSRTGYEQGEFALGGAIFLKQTPGRLLVKGGVSTDDEVTTFSKNEAGMGGAIYVSNNGDDLTPRPSPIIGGADVSATTRDFGLKIKFVENTAITAGGAIYTKRNMSINGGGGIVNESIYGYGPNYYIDFSNNEAGYAGGAIAVQLSNSTAALSCAHKTIQFTRALFKENEVGYTVTGDNRQYIRGGGAVYSLFGDININKAVIYEKNKVKNGNGAAIAMVAPDMNTKRYYVTDLDNVTYSPATGVASFMTERNDVFTFNSTAFPPTTDMLTQFLDNEVEVEEDVMAKENGTGTTQVGAGTVETTVNLDVSAFSDADHGVLAGAAGTIIQLTRRPDGINWLWQYRNWAGGEYFYDGVFTSTMNALMVGESGIIVKTTDQGITWTQKRPGTSEEDLFGVFSIANGNCFAVGQNGIVLKSINGGETWGTPTYITNDDLKSVFFTSQEVGYIVGKRGFIAKTINGGNYWEIININTTANLNSVFFQNVNTGYAVGDNGLVLKTTNAGQTWSPSIIGGFNLLSVKFTSETTGFATATNNVLFKTNDGGATWTQVTMPADPNYAPDLNKICWTGLNGFIAGDYGQAFQSADGGSTWTRIRPFDRSVTDVVRYHPDNTVSLVENGIGLGGAIYVLDRVSQDKANRADSVMMNRVRIQNNKAFSGSAIYSDNFGLNFVLSRSLVTGNISTSEIGVNQNVITGAMKDDKNAASSDLAGAVFYCELQGPLPIDKYPEAANSIYNNTARFTIRIPDAPNTKGILAGTSGIGTSGYDYVVGNYWGHTEANVNMLVVHPSGGVNGVVQETFFLATDGENRLPYMHNPTTLLEQGPFESIGVFSYTPIPLLNDASSQDIPDYTQSIPEQLLMSGKVYDLNDKGTDIKIVNYSKRRMSPIEDFSVGMVRNLRTFTNATQPSFGKVVKRWTKDPFISENPAYPQLAQMQFEFFADKDGIYYHPIAYPVYLEALADYDGDPRFVNHDTRLINENVFIAVNENTGDYIRLNLKQVNESDKKEIFRTRFELVPDSSDRNPQPQVRRLREGLLTFGSMVAIMQALYRNPYNEDAGALPGRKYTNFIDQFAACDTIMFRNRDVYPVLNNNKATYFAGERFNALPVNLGDQVTIISRTILWKDGWNEARNKGISFVVRNSTSVPQFTGDVVRMGIPDVITRPSDYPWENEDTISLDMYTNTVLVTEDRYYPKPDGWYSNPDDPNLSFAERGRDSIFTGTAIDENNFYDPRSYFYPGRYPRLTYGWSVPEESGLARWLHADTVKASAPMRDGALGYLVFKGRPFNPFIVPGGETVTVWVDNYPMHYRIIDSLRAMEPPIEEDVLQKYLNQYPSYYNVPKYDEATDRYLQQDTIDNGRYFRTYYSYKLYVLDSMPRFLEPGVRVDSVTAPSVYTCNLTADGRIKANLTDKLRMQIDLNTDDELEDKLYEGKWDFRYGRTSYGFGSIAYRPDEEVEFEPAQVRPSWMLNDYICYYGQETSDPFVRDFTREGKLNLRVPGDVARQMLTPTVQVNQNMNTDTVVNLVVNDGHGGINSKLMGVFVNVVPQILTTDLPDAKEDVEYNITDELNQLMDSTRMIKIYDPNRDQQHYFELIKADYPDDQIAIDPCFPEAGSIDLTNLKITPDWLNINPHSGMLYGVPGVKDAPRYETVVVVVWDMVDGEKQLATIAQIPLFVDSTNHKPTLQEVPGVRCVDKDKPYVDTLLAVDYDLLRGKGLPGDVTETLSLRIIEPNGLTITPSTINGTLSDDFVKVVISANDLSGVTIGSDGKVNVVVEIKDALNVVSTITYKLKISDPVLFTCPITVANSKGSSFVLEFGTASVAYNPSTGSGDDGKPTGTLDYNFCEYELPPPGDQISIFDTRWTIPQTMGVQRNIYPEAKSGATGVNRYRAQITAGGAGGSNYPLTLKWKLSDVPDRNNTAKNPTGASWYLWDPYSDGNYININMNTGAGRVAQNIGTAVVTGDECIVTISAVDFNGFVIFFDWTTGVNDNQENGYSNEIVSVSPNPMNPSETESTIEFNTMNYSRVRIEVIDNLGNIVSVITDNEYAAGMHTIAWNGRGLNGSELSSGSYMLRMTSGVSSSTYRMNIVK